MKGNQVPHETEVTLQLEGYNKHLELICLALANFLQFLQQRHRRVRPESSS